MDTEDQGSNSSDSQGHVALAPEASKRPRSHILYGGICDLLDRTKECSFYNESLSVLDKAHVWYSITDIRVLRGQGISSVHLHSNYVLPYYKARHTWGQFRRFVDVQKYRKVFEILHILPILHILHILHILPISFWQKERFQPRVYLLSCANTAQISALKNIWQESCFCETRLKPIQAVHLCISEQFVKIGYFKDCCKLLPWGIQSFTFYPC